jgi:hypothetical protein
MSDTDIQAVSNPERRSLLVFSIALIGAGISGVLGYAIFGYAVGQALKPTPGGADGHWLEIGSLDKFYPFF